MKIMLTRGGYFGSRLRGRMTAAADVSIDFSDGRAVSYIHQKSSILEKRFLVARVDF
jgi:hypothetical protein